MIAGTNTLATNTATSATGENQAPKSPDSVQVKVSGELMHIQINHAGELQRGIRYFSEVSTNPSFSQPLVIDHGSSRTSHPISLPTKDDSGKMVNYYVRSFAQYLSSQPSQPTVVGGLGKPTVFNMAGSTQMTLLPSTGSGTAPSTGQAAGQGLGKVQRRQ
jgi:hypothetical protein